MHERVNIKVKQSFDLSKSRGKQEVGDDLNVCMLNILPKVSSLPCLLARKSYESGYIDFSNGSVTSRWSLDERVMYIICHVAPQDHSI